MASAQILNCIVCDEPVRLRQQAIQCDGCFRWNHRICNTGKFSALQQLMQYVGRNWITSSTWPPSSWSVFMKSIRTNNDIEGWHLGLNRRASGKSQLPLYLLISHPFRSGLFPRRSYGESRRKSSETSRPRYSTFGMSSTLVPAVQGNY